MAEVFGHLGLHVVEAATLKEALQQLQQQTFDVICLDLLLPDGNGVEVLRRVRDQKLAAKVIVISAADEPNTLAEVTRLKPEAIFGKPLDLEDFLNWLESQGILEPA